MRYPVVIEPGSDRTAWGVIVPGLPGCFAAGDTFEQSLENAREAIELHLDLLLEGDALRLTLDGLDGHAAVPSDWVAIWSWIWSASAAQAGGWTVRKSSSA